MRVTVAIVAYRNADDIVRCLTALDLQTYRNFDVVICENGGGLASTQLRDAIAAASPRVAVEVIEAPDNPGYAGGVNRCLAERPDADAWWVLNPDTVPAPGALSAMAERLARGDADAVGSSMLDGIGVAQGGGGRFSLALARTAALQPGAAVEAEPGAMNYVAGASMLVSRRWLKVTGPMREDYFLYCEEVEWCLRAQRRGLRVALAPAAQVTHHQGSTTGSAGAIASRQRLPIVLDERNKLNTVRDTAPLLLATAIPAAFVLAWLRYARRGAWRQLGYALSGWAAGVRNERGKPRWL